MIKHYDRVGSKIELLTTNELGVIIYKPSIMISEQINKLPFFIITLSLKIEV